MIDIQVILQNLDKGEMESQYPLEGQVMRILCAEVERHQWIRINEQLPPMEKPIWLYCPNEVRAIWVGCYTDTGEGCLWADCNRTEYWNGNEWDCEDADFEDYHPTHWMPLPNAPD